MRIFGLILTLCLAFSFNLNAQGKKKKQTEEVTFEVSMSCNNCKQKIEKNIAWEKGVKDMEVDLDDKTVKVKYDANKTSTENLKKAIENLGFASVEEQKEKPAVEEKE